MSNILALDKELFYGYFFCLGYFGFFSALFGLKKLWVNLH